MSIKKISTILGAMAISIILGVSCTNSTTNVTDDSNIIQREQKATYEVLVESIETDGIFSTTIHVVVTNNGDNVNYLQVTVPIYDNNGVKIADGLGNTGALKAGEKVKLDILITEVLYEGEYQLGDFEVTTF